MSAKGLSAARATVPSRAASAPSMRVEATFAAAPVFAAPLMA